MNYPNFISHSHTGWTLMLPYLEQGPLYKSYDFNHPSGPTQDNSGEAAPFPPNADFTINQPVVLTPLAVLTCPSDQTPAGTLYNYAPADNKEHGVGGAEMNAAKSNYVFCSGAINGIAGNPYAQIFSSNPMNGRIQGIFGHNGAATISDVTDGLSNTVAITEAKQSSIGVFNAGANLSPGPLWGVFGTSSVAFICQPGPPESVGTGVQQVYAYVEGVPNGPQMDLATGLPTTTVSHRQNNTNSYHPGGIQCVFADGSVRFVSERVQWEVWKYQNFCRDDVNTSVP